MPLGLTPLHEENITNRYAHHPITKLVNYCIRCLEENIVRYILTIYWCDKAKGTIHRSKIKQ